MVYGLINQLITGRGHIVSLSDTQSFYISNMAQRKINIIMDMGFNLGIHYHGPRGRWAERWVNRQALHTLRITVLMFLGSLGNPFWWHGPSSPKPRSTPHLDLNL